MRLLSLLFIILLFDLGLASAADQPKQTASQQIKRQADKMHASKMYFAAIPFYQKLLSQQADSENVWKLADCYWHIGYYDSAVVYLKKANIHPTISSERLAEYYVRKGDYAMAMVQFDEAIAHANEKEKAYLINKKQSATNYKLLLKDSLDWTINYLSVNTSAREYAPSLYNGELYFISNRDAGFIVPKTNLTDGLPYDGVYNAGALPYLRAVNPVAVKRMPLKYNSRLLVDLTPNTSNDNNVLQPVSRIQMHTPSGSMLPRILKNAVFRGHVGPISLANNSSEIYFTRTSRRKVNGVFQLEICKSVKKGNGWSTPVVLAINDSLSSSFHPYYDEKNQALYFSSDRAGGQGGADIYKSSLESGGTWSQPVNLGSTINSMKDEGFPTVSDGKLYFSSNGWPGLGGVDIFTVDLKESNSAPKNLGFPINSNSDDYSIVFSDTKTVGYFATNRYGSDDILGFNYAPKYVTVKSAVTNEKTGLRQAGVKVVLEQQEANNTWKELDSYVTDHKGVYTFKVRPNQSNYRFRLLGENVATAEKVQYFDTEGVTASKELAAIDVAVQANANEQAETATSNVSAASTNASSPTTSAKSDKVASKNNGINSSTTQRTTFRIYHYFNSAGYVLESHKDLQKVISLMNSNSGLRLKISSAADCYGTAASNLALSKRRAMYIQSQFPKSLQGRISVNWYGDTKPAKPCNDKNRTYISEQINRYTQIEIL